MVVEWLGGGAGGLLIHELVVSVVISRARLVGCARSSIVRLLAFITISGGGIECLISACRRPTCKAYPVVEFHR